MVLLPFSPDQRAYKPYLIALENLFADMDSAYEAAANQYGFRCRGCDDNCCRSSFHHHTLLEYLYLSKGLALLPSGLKGRILAQARLITESEQQPKTMCPANEDGGCLVYAFRPMICRLHGIPHMFTGANRLIQKGSGCHVFERDHGNLTNDGLDRTAIYRRMAFLEKELRQQVSFEGRIHLTVAQIVIHSLSEAGLSDIGGSPAPASG